MISHGLEAQPLSHSVRRESACNHNFLPTTTRSISKFHHRCQLGSTFCASSDVGVQGHTGGLLPQRRRGGAYRGRMDVRRRCDFFLILDSCAWSDVYTHGLTSEVTESAIIPAVLPVERSASSDSLSSTVSLRFLFR